MRSIHSARALAPAFRLGLAVLCLGACALAAAEPAVEIKKVEEGRIDITLDGAPFTAYRWNDTDFFEKPIFYPILTADGGRINREFPMVKDVPGEQADHPHQQSLFFTYDEVNGTHFWNKQANPTRRIKNREAAIDGSSLKLTLDWIDDGNEPVLTEERTVTFGAAADLRWMDHAIVLTAVKDAVFGDTKEGAFGIRVAPGLQEQKGEGHFYNAQGLLGGMKVWGKTSEWVALEGPVEGPKGREDVTLAILSHPTTVNHPPYWHARYYGLFAVNPFGANSYDKKVPVREMKLAKGESFRLRFRVAVYKGKVGAPRVAADYAEFAK